MACFVNVFTAIILFIIKIIFNRQVNEKAIVTINQEGSISKTSVLMNEFTDLYVFTNIETTKLEYNSSEYTIIEENNFKKIRIKSNTKMTYINSRKAAIFSFYFDDEIYFFGILDLTDETVNLYPYSDFIKDTTNLQQPSLTILDEENFLITTVSADNSFGNLINFNLVNNNYTLIKKINLNNKNNVEAGFQCDFMFSYRIYFCISILNQENEEVGFFLMDENFTGLDDDKDYSDSDYDEINDINKFISSNFSQHINFSKKFFSYKGYPKQAKLYKIPEGNNYLIVVEEKSEIFLNEVEIFSEGELTIFSFDVFYNNIKLGLDCIAFIDKNNFFFYASYKYSNKLFLRGFYTFYNREKENKLFTEVHTMQVTTMGFTDNPSYLNSFIFYFQKNSQFKIFYLTLNECTENKTIRFYSDSEQEINFSYMIKDYLNKEPETLSINFLPSYVLYEKNILFYGILKSDEGKKYVKVQNGLQYTKLKMTLGQPGTYELEYIIMKDVFEEIVVPSTICKIKITFGCYDSCSSCKVLGNSSNNYCNNCKKGYYFLEGTSNCLNTPPDFHYLDKTDNVIRQCHRLCTTCYDKGNELEHHCLKCKSPYIKKSFYTNKTEDEHNCVKICNLQNSYWYQDGTQFFCIKNSLKCPSDYPFLNKKTKECTKNYYETSNLSFNTDVSSKNINELINDNYEFFSSKKRKLAEKDFRASFTSIFSNGTYVVSDSNIDHFTMKLENECEKKIREKYSLENDSPIEMVNINYYNSTTSKEIKVAFHLFSSKGELLNISVCKENNIEIEKKITSELFEFLSNKGDFLVNLRKSDDFYNGYCSNFTDTETKKDLTIFDRRTIYLNTSTFCNENCTFLVFKKTTQKLSCICPIQEEYTFQNNFNPKEKLIEIEYSNKKLLKCYKVFFSNEVLKIFMFYFLFLLPVAQIAVGAYCIIENKKAKDLELKAIERAKTIGDAISKRKTPRFNFLFTKDSKNGLSLTASNDSLKESETDPIKAKNQLCQGLKIKKKFDSNIISSNDLGKKPIKKHKIKVPEIKLIIKNKSSKVVLHQEIMSFKKIFQKKNPIYFTFFSYCQSKVERLIKISYFISVIFSFVFFQGYVYNDYYISEYYKNEGTFSAEISKFLIGLTLGKLVEYIFRFSVYILLVGKGGQNLIFFQTEEELVNCFLFLYVFGLVSCDIIYFYFGTIFSHVYPNSVVTWMTCSVLSLVFFIFVIPLVFTSLIFLIQTINTRALLMPLASITELLLVL